MFGLFSSVEKKMRANAANWLELADKIFHYRRDELTTVDRADLQQKTEQLRGQLRERADASKIKLGIESLEPVLRRTGGRLYPKSTMQEYVEFFIVAAIVVLGLRAYFVQPFKIPTNSMWPTYYGMTPEAYPNPADAPGAISKAARFVMYGAQRKELVAPIAGRVAVPVLSDASGEVRLPYTPVKGRKWLFFPTTEREYVFFVGEKTVRLRVPSDFEFDWAFREALAVTPEQLHKMAESSPRTSSGYRLISLPKPVEKGQVFLSFDVLTGDQLFVDRMSYHFVRPRVGDGFVFRTGNIPYMAGNDQYYIKRLAGVPGDQVEIRPPELLRNGKPIKGSKAFGLNQNREGLYRGYLNAPRDRGVLLSPNEKVTIPKTGYLALGDNSTSSLDSRFWGFVPAKDIVGRPLFIYYPFTKRWGVAK